MSESIESPRGRRKRKKSSRTTLYDAVAGRIGRDGFIYPVGPRSKGRDTITQAIVPLPPDEVLFTQNDAPERFEEADIYFATRWGLEGDSELPDSGLVEALHRYAADFYARTGGEEAYWSLDETALLALGMLIEEAVAEEIGDDGWKALVMDEREDEDLVKEEPVKDEAKQEDEDVIKVKVEVDELPKRGASVRIRQEEELRDYLRSQIAQHSVV